MTDPPDPREELITHLGAMRAFAVSLTRNRVSADDLVQDTILKAWTRIESYTPGTNMRAWLFTILRNTFYSDRRKAAREEADVDGKLAKRLAVKPADEGRLIWGDFCRAFARLPDEQREALILVGALGFRYAEAAKTCGVAIGTIKSRTSRGRRSLAVTLQRDDVTGIVEPDRVIVAVLNAQPRIW
jgi:RNA polymerase sigma-70 factor (ECF subfamily)